MGWKKYKFSKASQNAKAVKKIIVARLPSLKWFIKIDISNLEQCTGKPR